MVASINFMEHFFRIWRKMVFIFRKIKCFTDNFRNFEIENKSVPTKSSKIYPLNLSGGDIRPLYMYSECPFWREPLFKNGRRDNLMSKKIWWGKSLNKKGGNCMQFLFVNTCTCRIDIDIDSNEFKVWTHWHYLRWRGLLPLAHLPGWKTQSSFAPLFVKFFYMCFTIPASSFPETVRQNFLFEF